MYTPDNRRYLSDALKIEFPTWGRLLRGLASEYALHSEATRLQIETSIKKHVALLDHLDTEIQNTKADFHPAVVYQKVAEFCGSNLLEVSAKDRESAIFQLKLNGNEFYSIFNTRAGHLMDTDERIRHILGVNPSEFNMISLLGMDLSMPLFHPSDMSHSVRMGAVAFLVLTIPGLGLNSRTDYFRVRFRIGTKGSNRPELRDLEYLTLEKNAYILRDRKYNDPLPSEFLYKFCIFSKDEFDGVKPYFNTDPVRSNFMNAFHYLYHAILLGISPKFVLLLHEKSNQDRNKVIANHINKRIEEHTMIPGVFDEGSIGDCFSKTIRPKVGACIDKWEGLTTKTHVASDLQAIQLAKTLGLLPLPSMLQNLIYRNIEVL